VGNDRLESAVRGGGGDISPEALALAKASFEKAWEMHGDGDYRDCLRYLDQGFVALGLDGGYLEAGAAVHWE
jgi:hypothetical protein